MKRFLTWTIVLIILMIGIYFLNNHAQAFNYNACGEGDAGDQNPHCVPTSTPTPKPTATPTPIKCGEWDEYCEPTPTPTPTVTPVASPSATPAPSNNTGGSSGSDGGNQPPPVAQCGTPFDVPMIVGFNLNPGGNLHIEWTEGQTVDKYSLTYGYSANNLNMGEDNIPGNVTSWDIHQLAIGNHVWVQVQAWFNGCEESSNVYDPVVK